MHQEKVRWLQCLFFFLLNLFVLLTNRKGQIYTDVGTFKQNETNILFHFHFKFVGCYAPEWRPSLALIQGLLQGGILT